MFKNLFSAFLLFCLLSNSSKAQTTPFTVKAWKAGGADADAGHTIAVDGQGNIFVAGHQFKATFSANYSFDESAGFLAKYSSDGVVQWVQLIDGQISSIAVGKQGAIYMIGTRQGQLPKRPTTLYDYYNFQIFLAKYNSDGVKQWEQQFGGPGLHEGADLAVDESDNLYVTGLFSGKVSLGSKTLQSAGGTDTFIAKYNKGGLIQWATSAGGSERDAGISIGLDNKNRIYIGGSFEGTITIGATTLTSRGDVDLFVTRYTANGEAEWVQQIGGVMNDYIYDLALDKKGNVFVTGAYNETATFGQTAMTAKAPLGDAFVVKYSTSGQMQWVRSSYCTDSGIGRGLTVDEKGAVYITGYFKGESTFGATTLIPRGQNDIFLTKYSQNGKLHWVQHIGGAGYDSGTGITMNKRGEIFITGFFQEQVTFGSTTLTSSGYHDIFIAKYLKR
ncbi:SBBP repeat-containing protein [Telluribacter humicola]|uniref:SBBP repeat-containing protein n=1 Tax=Telluribacter humicola TaxID=1720261 RepID=UPI001A967E32|nr:SBBP repeat-containing protein [Telluribacter humicola]